MIFSMATSVVCANGAGIPELEIEWTKIMGTGTPVRQGYCGRQTKDGGYIVGGRIENTAKKSIDLLLIRLNSSRSIVWQKQYGGVANVNADSTAYDVQETVNGYFVGGESSVLAGGGGLVMKTDLSGNMIWQYAFGGPWYGLIYSIVPLPDSEQTIV